MISSLQLTAAMFAPLTSLALNMRAGSATTGANGDPRDLLVAAVMGTYSGQCVTIQDGTAADGASINVSMSGANGAGIAVDFTDAATVFSLSRTVTENGPHVSFESRQFKQNITTKIVVRHDPSVNGAVDQAVIERSDEAIRQTGVSCLNARAAAVAAIDPLAMVQKFLGTSRLSMLCSENGLHQIAETVGVTGARLRIGSESIDLRSNPRQTDLWIERPATVALHVVFANDRSISMVYTKAGQPSAIRYVDSAGALRNCIGQ